MGSGEAIAVAIFEDPPGSGSTWLATRVIYDSRLPMVNPGESTSPPPAGALL